jgi:hypothetical protein
MLTQIRVMGCTRRAFKVGGYAVKVPNVWYGWSAFLRGLLHNMEEAAMTRWLAEQPDTPGSDRICPVLWSCPGGWFVVMPWCERAFRPDDWLDIDGWWTEDMDSIEEMTKSDNVGYWAAKDRFVTFDYASSR